MPMEVGLERDRGNDEAEDMAGGNGLFRCSACTLRIVWGRGGGRSQQNRANTPAGRFSVGCSPHRPGPSVSGPGFASRARARMILQRCPNRQRVIIIPGRQPAHDSPTSFREGPGRSTSSQYFTSAGPKPSWKGPCRTAGYKGRLIGHVGTQADQKTWGRAGIRWQYVQADFKHRASFPRPGLQRCY